MNPNEVSYQNSVAGMSLLGEIICWSAKGNRPHAQVVTALISSGLDSEVAHEFQPRAAFTRAVKKLMDGRVIDVIREDSEEALFQFTKQSMDSVQSEWKYSTEAKVKLDKRTGKITCDDKVLEEIATKKLQECMTERTAADITKIVQKLFDKEADLFPIRDQGGVYFVPKNHANFVTRIDQFLGQVNGSIKRFPVPSGTQFGDKAVQDAVSEAMENLVKQHMDAINEFSVDTRSDTFVRTVEDIKATRIKIQAYAEYLKDQAEGLLEKVDDARRIMSTKVQSITQERQNTPPGQKVNHQFIFEFSITAVIRWMGRNKWSFGDAKMVVDSYTGKDVVAEATIRAQLLGGRNGQRGEPAPLTEEQGKELAAKLAELKTQAQGE